MKHQLSDLTNVLRRSIEVAAQERTKPTRFDDLRCRPFQAIHMVEIEGEQYTISNSPCIDIIHLIE